MDCNLQKNLSNCNCTYASCPRRGKCCECLAHHRQQQELPACYFGKVKEASYDRSIENYLS